MSQASLRSKLSATFGRPRFIRGIAILAGGAIIAQALPLLLTPILTRLFTPADMGLLALYLAFLGFATTGTTFGYSLAIVAAKHELQAADLTLVSGLLTFPFSIAAALFFWLLTDRGWIGFDALPSETAILMFPSLTLTGLFFTMRYWLVRNENYAAISSATVSQSASRTGSQIVLGVGSGGWVGLVLGEIVGRGVGLRLMWRQCWPAVTSQSFPLDITRLTRVILDYWKFPILSAPSSMLNSLALVLPVPLISAYFGLQAAGHFSLASRVLLLPLALIGMSVGDVFHNRIAEYSREGIASTRSFFLKVAVALFLMGILPMGMVFMFGESLFAIILGDQWATSGQLAAAITPWALAQLTVSPLSRVVTVFQRQELKLVYDLLCILSVFSILSLGHNQNWSLIWTCTILAWSQTFVYGVYFLLLYRIVIKAGRSATV